MIKKICLSIIIICLMYSCQSKDDEKVQINTTQEKKEKEVNMQFKLTSPAFKEEGMIPKKYTCDSENVSPPLIWGSVPEGTISLAIICDDPDAPMGTWVHWVLFNLPPETKELLENVSTTETLENGAKHGTNDFGDVGYGGPCPPGGTHRYFFKLYALDTMFNLKAGVNKGDLLNEMEGHIIFETQLMGKYSR
jgi:Raf kinase inhibitor-like YbhB/YbcL family protein